MATIGLVEVRSYRPNIILLGHQTAAGVDGNQDNDFTLPNSIALCEILEVLVLAESIDVAVTSFDTGWRGVFASMKSITSASPEKDFVGHDRWILGAVGTGVSRCTAVIKPDNPVLWSPDLSLRITYGEVDSDATPTAVVTYMVRVQSVEPEVGIGFGKMM